MIMLIWVIWKVAEYSKWGLLGHPSMNLKDNNTKSNVNYGCPTQGISEANNIINYAWKYFWVILAKKKGVPSVFLGPKNLSKSFELISVSE